jgi:hypothetical protein
MDWLVQHVRLDWLPVVALVAGAGQAAWEDFRTGRIRNVLLGRLLLAVAVWFWTLAVAVGVFELDRGLIFPAHSLPDYFLRIAHNTGLALALGIILWFARLWAAGDSKIFPLIVALLPLRFYAHEANGETVYVGLWPAFVLFYNFVLATMLIILVDLLHRGGTALVAHLRARRARRAAPQDDPPAQPLLARAAALARAHAADWGRFALMLILVFMFVKVLRHYLGEAIALFVHLDSTILFVVLFFACHPIIRLMRHNWVLAAAAAIDLVFLGIASFTDWLPGFGVTTMVFMSVTAFLLMFFRMAYDAYQARMDYLEIEVDDLRAKMVLSDSITQRLTTDRGYFEAQQAELGPLLADGLHPEQVALVQRWARERLPGTPLQVQKTFPMGPPIFVGLLLTIIFQDYALHLPR